MPIQSSGETWKKRPSFKAISALTARFFLQIMLMVIGVEPIAFATAYADNRSGFMKSSRNTSPG